MIKKRKRSFGFDLRRDNGDEIERSGRITESIGGLDVVDDLIED